jgi:hypothetical protein
MLRLSAALSKWEPSESASVREPIVLLEAAWPDIVGPQVAKSSFPTRIVDGTLFVTTRSSGWSHQLSLLAEHVLRAISARLPNAGLTQLRFRVGTLPQRRRTAGGATATTRSRAIVAYPPAESAPEALARFRKQVEGSNQAKRSEGWKECAECGALVAPRAQLCPACVASTAQRRAEATARLLFEAPWLGYNGTAALVDGLQEGEYERVRAQLLTRWWGMLVQARAANRLSRDGRERLIASSYVLLRSKIPPEQIIPATVRSILGDDLHDLIYVERQEK